MTKPILSILLAFSSVTALASTNGGGLLLEKVSYVGTDAVAPMGGTGGGGVLPNNLLSTHGGGLLNLAIRFESESPDGFVRFSVLDKETMKTSDRFVDGTLLSPNELRVLESSIETGSWVEF